MRSFGRILGRLLIVFILAFLALWAIAPVDKVDTEISFDPNSLTNDLDGFLQNEEHQFSDIVPGAEKRIVWAGEKGQKTALSVIYLHGYSATSEEVRPLPDIIASSLKANLFYTRLAGHGRGGAAMAEPSAGDWLDDTAEALAIGRRLGDRVLIISTSTGATLAAIAATDPEMSKDLAGIVMISPNFGVRNLAARILDLPLARYWGPVVAGKERSFPVLNEKHAKYWTTTYPTIALFPMAALVRYAKRLDYAQAKTPAMFIYAEADQVIDPAAIPPVVAAWGGPTRVEKRVVGPKDDPYSHVIAGNTLSPSQTAPLAALILDWVRGL